MNDEEISNLVGYIEKEFYDMLKGTWKKAIVKGLLLQSLGFVVALIIGMIIRYEGIEVTLSLIDIGVPPLELSTVATTIFQVTVAVSGIILGFGAVCVSSLCWIGVIAEWSIMTRNSVEQEASRRRMNLSTKRCL